MSEVMVGLPNARGFLAVPREKPGRCFGVAGGRWFECPDERLEPFSEPIAFEGQLEAIAEKAQEIRESCPWDESGSHCYVSWCHPVYQTLDRRWHVELLLAVVPRGLGLYQNVEVKESLYGPLPSLSFVLRQRFVRMQEIWEAAGKK